MIYIHGTPSWLLSLWARLNLSVFTPWSLQSAWMPHVRNLIFAILSSKVWQATGHFQFLEYSKPVAKGYRWILKWWNYFFFKATSLTAMTVCHSLIAGFHSPAIDHDHPHESNLTFSILSLASLPFTILMTFNMWRPVLRPTYGECNKSQAVIVFCPPIFRL